MLVRLSDLSIVSETEFRREHSNVSFPPGDLTSEIVAPYGYGKLVKEPRPNLTPWQDARHKSAPEQINGEWRLGWVIEDIPISARDVKAEAERRILAIIPEWKQRNLIAQATRLLDKGRSNWTAEEAAAWKAGEAIWAQVAAIRAASDEIEAMKPIPRDFIADIHWP